MDKSRPRTCGGTINDLVIDKMAMDFLKIKLKAQLVHESETKVQAFQKLLILKTLFLYVALQLLLMFASLAIT